MFKIEQRYWWIFKVAFFSICFFELIAEYIENSQFIFVTKLLLLPSLILLYLVTTKNKSNLYLAVLLFNYPANVMYVSNHLEHLILASILFLISRFLLIVKVYKIVKLPNMLPFFIGSVPFLILFLTLLNLVYSSINATSLYMTLAQIVLITVLGGLSLSNFILKNDTISGYLLVSALFFSISIFILGVKFYYLDLKFFKPISMFFFVIGHYVLYKFIILNENVDVEINN